MAKPITPYQRLLVEFREYADKVDFPNVRSMWRYPKNRLGEGWALTDLWERTKAAEQLGYDVVLVASDDGINVKYVKKRPDRPWVTSRG